MVGFIEILKANDPFNVTIVNVTSHTMTIRWDNPTAEDSFLIEALRIKLFITDHSDKGIENSVDELRTSQFYPLFNSSNEVSILFK